MYMCNIKIFVVCFFLWGLIKCVEISHDSHLALGPTYVDYLYLMPNDLKEHLKKLTQ